ncbi:hypothetical protein BZB76_1748 [Actinomadura pelletieri DSM 43383]|uniref:Uncharacterized protein n=1 Tax=Actinomadura pelletieri DSM 43383 TaxID=1120940 RepID=A0A495QSG9_9ACTN|nr:hypothetical protein [Actinomadura pelletieri]RKS76393.1 hypothetical protein BZB76_1748 [Actinomadura pelletieri DSM 43383]
MILEALADCWGHVVDPHTSARTVWAEVSKTPRPALDGGVPCEVVR